VVEDARRAARSSPPAASASASEGNFFAPTILADVPLDASVFNDEPFGPVAAVRGFDSLDEAIAEANRLPFGLAGYAFTRSIKNAHLLMNRMEVGMLWINQPATPSAEMPFGGIKDSGYGSEGGPEALEAYLNTKAVSDGIVAAVFQFQAFVTLDHVWPAPTGAACRCASRWRRSRYDTEQPGSFSVIVVPRMAMRRRAMR
jgi:acyl-CoA reductase-like NAD-dependent aldehyde dehydrogenase